MEKIIKIFISAITMTISGIMLFSFFSFYFDVIMFVCGLIFILSGSYLFYNLITLAEE